MASGKRRVKEAKEAAKPEALGLRDLVACVRDREALGLALGLPVVYSAAFVVSARGYRLLGRMGADLASHKADALVNTCVTYLWNSVPHVTLAALGTLLEKRLEWRLRETVQDKLLDKVRGARLYPCSDLGAAGTRDGQQIAAAYVFLIYIPTSGKFLAKL